MKPSAPDMLRRLTAAHVDALTAGATLLGSGGGGAVALGGQLLRHVLSDRSVDVVTAGALPPDACVVHVGVVGGPDVLAERLIDPRDLASAARAVVDTTGGRLDAVGIIEIGGLNATAAVLAAAELNLPLVDSDLMGRAFPSIKMTTLAVAGHSPTPLALVSPAGDIVVVPTGSARMAESLMGASAAAMGGAAALAIFPTTAQVLRKLGIRGSLSSCVTLGTAYLEARGGATALVERLGGRLLVDGRVDELRSRRDDTPGSITMSDRASGATSRIDHLDEFLAVTTDGVTVAATPDVIVALDRSNRAPLRTDQVRLGQPLVVFALAPLHIWPEGAERVVGPAAFGLDLEVAR